MPYPLIVISGPKFSGKTTLAGHLCDEFPELKRLITYTTRKPQPDERDGEHYHFISEEKFKELEDRLSFIESTTSNDDSRFGTLRSSLIASVIRQPTLVVLNPKGADRMAEISDNAHFIFVVAPPKDTELRCSCLREYSELEGEITEETLAVRQPYYACIINNGNGHLGRSMKQLKRFVYSAINQ
jgi:guanylate kinase